eukprot:CAMPEP_0115303842 /NCGR_PEP_ID=MMETSP0270-20121206/71138_1 /TAXON_ID=71861 /ORGANISM="Scrippsiella trochoidea, Strain CCMP3099" /LENGTH=80 /DNA_ID=CAMNT_0002721875 /DNA_START=1044 /DNA_END=1283 /DNA_ORIENTATION=+
MTTSSKPLLKSTPGWVGKGRLASASNSTANSCTTGLALMRFVSASAEEEGWSNAPSSWRRSAASLAASPTSFAARRRLAK